MHFPVKILSNLFGWTITGEQKERKNLWDISITALFIETYVNDTQMEVIKSERRTL